MTFISSSNDVMHLNRIAESIGKPKLVSMPILMKGFPYVEKFPENPYPWFACHLAKSDGTNLPV